MVGWQENHCRNPRTLSHSPVMNDDSVPLIPPLRIGTRSSPLALAQARLFAARLKDEFPAIEADIISIKASGDHNPKEADARLVDKGGKGLFTKELEEALKDERIDVAVHSLKDVPTWLPDGLTIAAVLPRADARDAFISLKYQSLGAMPAGAVIGTSSLRRQAQILARFPHVKVVPFRGNVDTRLKKLADGQVDATLLAHAGLCRLNMTDKATKILDADEFLPAVGQGIIGLQIRADDGVLAAMLAHMNCKETMQVMQAERAMLEVLDGSCHTPIAGHAVIKDGQVHLKGLVAHPEGKGVWQADGRGSVGEAMDLGRHVGRTLRRLVPTGILPA